MEKYVGKYRVVQQVDSNGDFSDNFDDTYVMCKNNIKMFRYGDDVLGLYIETPIMANNLQQSLWNYLTDFTQSQLLHEINNSSNHRLSGEWMFYFYEKYIDEIAKIIVPRIKGAGYHPRSVNNLPNKNRKVNYIPNDEVLLNQFKEKIKRIIDSNSSNISLYIRAYQYIEKRLQQDITAFSKEKNIKFTDALDAMGLIESAITLLDDFVKII